MTEQRSEFDFAAFKDAFERKDLDRWLPFYADDAEWIEYRHASPPRAPNLMVSKGQIADFLARVCGAEFGITIADEVIGAGRLQRRLRLPRRKAGLRARHIVRIENGKIARQVDVEAWDE